MPPTELLAVIPDDFEVAVRDLKIRTVDELRLDLAEALGLSATHIIRASLIIRALEEKGEDLSDLGLTFLPYFRRVAYGQVAPEVVVQFAHKATLLRLASNLPMPDQKKLASGKPIELVVKSEGRGYDKRLADPLKMQPDQLKQVMGAGAIRDEQEQILLLESREPESKGQSPRRTGDVIPDPMRGGLRVGRTFLPVADVLMALGELHPGLPPDDHEKKVSVSVNLSPVERKRINTAAAKSGHSVQTLIYRAIIQAGLLASIDGE